MIIIFTGNGKGKTTAALGQMVRVLGRGRNALMIQFIKGPWRSGEDEFVRCIKCHVSSIRKAGREDLLNDLGTIDKFEIKKMGKGFVGILGDKLPKEEHRGAAEEALKYFKSELASGKYDLIVLDEINVATSLGLLRVGDVLEAIRTVPDEKFLIMTGRNAPQEFIDAAHLVTEMREIKHPFNDGKMAQIALEF